MFSFGWRVFFRDEARKEELYGLMVKLSKNGRRQVVAPVKYDRAKFLHTRKFGDEVKVQETCLGVELEQGDILLLAEPILFQGLDFTAAQQGDPASPESESDARKDDEGGEEDSSSPLQDDPAPQVAESSQPPYGTAQDDEDRPPVTPEDGSATTVEPSDSPEHGDEPVVDSDRSQDDPAPDVAGSPELPSTPVVEGDKPSILQRVQDWLFGSGIGGVNPTTV